MPTFFVRLQGALPGGESWVTGHHFTGSGTVTDVLTPLLAAADVLWDGDGGTVNGVTAYYPSTVTLTTGVVYELSSTTGKATDRDQTGLGKAGTALDDPLPHEVAVCCSLRSGLPGPSGRGRSYMPGPTVTNVTGLGRLDTIARNDFAAAMAGYLTTMQAGGYTPVLHTLGKADRPIISVDVGDVFDAQRRRRDKLIESRHSVSV